MQSKKLIMFQIKDKTYPDGTNSTATVPVTVIAPNVPDVIYVPKGVKLDKPLQSYFRINSELMGQFERTLIICDEGSDLHYVEGCTATKYSKDSLHAATVEIIVKKDAKCRYSTVQNWSDNI